MKVQQIATILNTINAEVTQDIALVNEDLSNIVDVGTAVFNSNWKDNYVKSMIDQIGKMVFVNRPYSGYAPSILRSNWEYGSILAKARVKDFDAKANPSWGLIPGTTVNQFEYNPPVVVQTFWNMKEAWQVDCSFAEEQAKSALMNAGQANEFFNMIETVIFNSRNTKISALVMRALNNFAGEKLYANNGVINVLSAYNAAYGTTLTAAAAPYDKAFLRFLAYTILDLKDRLKVRSEIYNMNSTGYPTATPEEYLHVVMNSAFGRAMDVFLQSDTYHNELSAIGAYETVPFWQGSGTAYTMSDRTSIDIKLASDNTKTVQQAYIIGMLFDRDAIALNNENERTTSAYNANGEYYNNFYKCETSIMNDTAENGIILVCA